MQAIESEVRGLFPDAYFYKVATHEFMTRASRKLLRRSDLAIVCGTNLLSPHFLWPKWKLRPWDIFALDHAVLLGVGWYSYRRTPDIYTRWFLNRILKRDAIHSVRSTYTVDRLKDIRRRVCNTACPTMWSFSRDFCKTIPRR